MKRLFTAVLAVLTLISLTACAGSGKPPSTTPEPTDKAADNTAAPTAEPTAEPTEAPTPEPTAEPYYQPFEVPLGKLTDGPMLPEGGEYLVIKGESDIFYVYNKEGMLLYCFNAVADEDEYCFPGVYGPKGVCCGVRLATGEKIGDPEYLGDMIFTWERHYDEDADEYHSYIKNVYNSDFELLCAFEEGEAEIGLMGGILHIDNKLLVLSRGLNWGNGMLNYNCRPRLYSESGEFIREIDPSPFGVIYGVLGGKYLIGTGRGSDDIDPYENRYNVYTLDGELVMEKAKMEYDSAFAPDSEVWQGMLFGVDYVMDGSGQYYDGDLQPVDKIPDDIGFYRMSEPYRLLFGRYDTYEGFRFSEGNVFVGIKDADGNWLFRIYNPGMASDSDADGEHYYEKYDKYSRLRNYLWELEYGG